MEQCRIEIYDVKGEIGAEEAYFQGAESQLIFLSSQTFAMSGALAWQVPNLIKIRTFLVLRGRSHGIF